MTGAIWFLVMAAGVGSLVLAPGMANRFYRKRTYHPRKALDEAEILGLFSKDLYNTEKVLFSWKTIAEALDIPWQKLRPDDTLDRDLRGRFFDPFTPDFGIEIQELRRELAGSPNQREISSEVSGINTVGDLIRAYARK